MESININDVKDVKGAKIIDVRETYEFEGGTIKGAINIPMTGLMMNADNFLDKKEKYYIMCQGGGRSMQVCSVLESQGYYVVNLTGGYSSYKN